jgi:hypothetical protein
MFYGVEEIKAILGVQRTKAYSIIRTLRADLKSEGYIKPPAGKIQKRYFCERYHLDINECESFLKSEAICI